MVLRFLRILSHGDVSCANKRERDGGGEEAVRDGDKEVLPVNGLHGG